LDVRERKRVRHEVAEGEALRLDDAHQTPHALLAARAQGRPDRVIAEAGRDELSRDREMARVDPEARERPPGADARQAAFERRWQAQRFDGHVDAATGESLDLEGRVLACRSGTDSTAMTSEAPHRRAPAVAHRPMGPCAKTATASPTRTRPVSAAEMPVDMMSGHMRTSASVRSPGMRARFACASGTRTYSAWHPSMVLPNRHPPAASKLSAP